MVSQAHCSLLETILSNSKKIYVCPLCHTSYSDAANFFKHCRAKGKKDPADIQHRWIGEVNQKGGFANFLASLGNAIGWSNITANDLPLDFSKPGPREYGACFKVSFVLGAKTRLEPPNGDKRLEILKTIARNAGIHYACPLCMTGFATSSDVVDHCRSTKDTDHQGLLSKEQNDFLNFYECSMGRAIKTDKTQIYYDEYGNPDFGECFRLDEILKHKM
jgi:hypothetical protein